MNERSERGQRYWLPPHVLARSRIEGTVLLDLKQNRYFALSVSDALALSRIVPNWPEPSEHPLRSATTPAQPLGEKFAATLLRAGLLSTAQPTEHAQVGEVTTARAAVGEEISEKATISWDLATTFFRAYFWASLSIRKRPLQHIRNDVMAMRSASVAPATATLESETVRLVSAFRRLRPCSFTARDRCLVHSLALIKFMAQYDVFPTWIIGVTLRPWAAHSWVQQRELVLDSTPEKVSPFTPILVV